MMIRKIMFARSYS